MEQAAKTGVGFFISKFSAVKNGMLALADLEASPNPRDQIAAGFFRDYENELARQNAFDFDDLIDKVVLILTEHADLRAKYERRFTHVLVDEYQDINNRQYDLIRLLAGNAKNVSVVGDDHQTIYTWRGSNIGVFLNFDRDWPNGETVTLEENYRSTRTIIRAASAVIQNNQRQKPKTLRTRKPDGEKIALIEAGDEEEEAAWIVAGIQGSGAGNQNGTIAILYRTNAQSRPLEHMLARAEIPYVIYGGLKFYERREIKDIVAALRIAANPKDAVSRERLETNLTKTLVRALEPRLAEMGGMRPADAIARFLETTRYLERLDRAFPNAEERRENVAELIRFAGAFETLTPMIEQISLVQATDPAPNPPVGEFGAGQGLPLSNRRPIVLSTIHLAKGLEFDHVFVAGCAEGLLPHGRSQSDADALEEERRLMYVAMTRAKERLTLSFFDTPSRFLGEIPAELIVFANQDSRLGGTSIDDEERYITLD
jgi:DNA helicase-2/ATP-dependent DNA helicase PcrA